MVAQLQSLAHSTTLCCLGCLAFDTLLLPQVVIEQLRSLVAMIPKISNLWYSRTRGLVDEIVECLPGVPDVALRTLVTLHGLPHGLATIYTYNENKITKIEAEIWRRRLFPCATTRLWRSRPGTDWFGCIPRLGEVAFIVVIRPLSLHALK